MKKLYIYSYILTVLVNFIIFGVVADEVHALVGILINSSVGFIIIFQIVKKVLT